MIFNQPKYLWLLLLIPVFLIMQAVVLKLRRRRIRKFGDEALVNELMPSYSLAKVWLRISLFSVAFLFFVLALARPQTGAIMQERELRGAEVMIVLDVSNSMLAEDYSPNRLERAKLAISRVVDKLQEDRIGLIVFAGNSSVLLPLTVDYISAKNFISSVSTESVPIQGTALGDAINLALRSFSEGTDRSRAIVVITDGENHEDDPVAVATAAAAKGVRIFTIGVGTPEGKMIPMGENGQYLEDENGEPVVTRLSEDVLKEIAEVSGGLYLRAGNTEFGLNPIIEEINNMEDTKSDAIVVAEYEEQYMYFLGVALFFLVLEILVGDRRSKRHLFKR